MAEATKRRTAIHGREKGTEASRQLAACSLLLLVWLGCGEGQPDPSEFAVAPVVDEADGPARRAACAHRDARKMALFGDLHVHTMLSSDARNYELDVRPDGAYRYAFGQEILLPPRDEQGRGTRVVRIDRPLDFAAVTDHAEFLGETALCSDPISPSYYTEKCQALRASRTPSDSPFGFKIMHPAPSRDAEICGEDGQRCSEAMQAGWTEIQRAAAAWNDSTEACERTTFVAWEYSSHRLGSNLHRNVIFRNERVPKRPISYMDVQREWELWSLLQSACNDSDTGCEAIAIPHNSNISNGRMFATDYPGASTLEEQADRARLRVQIEPIVEIMQHKGDSECRRGLVDVMGSDDALCDFEKFESAAFSNVTGEDDADGVGTCYDGPLADWVPHLGPDCLSRRSYVRYALAEGLAEEERIGVNPFKFGLMASTDTHNGLAGGVQERTWPGHLGIADGSPERRLRWREGGSMGDSSNNPGGLIGVWAEENARDAIFDAMQRKEVFGTSGPRIEPRLYAGWALPVDLCERPDPLGVALASGVPMGADLPPREGEAGPAFAVWARRDPGTAEDPGGLLQRIQIVKGWVDAAGVVHESVFDVAGGPNEADVDPATCTPRGPGHAALCGVWRDPDFDPSRRAVYYARIVENPSCRYSAWQCLALPESERPSGCAHDLMQPIQQERAWTSPVWYSPAEG